MILYDISKRKNRLECRFRLDNCQEEKIIWMCVNECYAEGLCEERADGFVILLLPLAMKLKESIISNIPVTANLLYQLNRNFIPSIAKNSNSLSIIKVIAEPKTSVENKGAVGVGCSGGIDSLYSIRENLNIEYKGFNITHLCVFNNLTQRDKSRDMFTDMGNAVKNIAEKLKLKYVICDSNCMSFIDVPEDYNFLNTYVIAFYILCLQRLFGRYYIGSDGKGLTAFSVKNADYSDCAHYDLLTLYCISNDKLQIVLSDCSASRNEKLRKIMDWNISTQYLKVCNESKKNCGMCGKCKRTIMSLEAFGVLNNFGQVFDLKQFYEYKAEYYYWLFKMHCMGSGGNEYVYIEEAYQMLKDTELMQQVIENDKLWKSFIYAKGIYEDGWIQGRFEAKSIKSPKQKKMRISIYVSSLTPNNIIRVYTGHQLAIEEEVTEGMWNVEIDIPDSNFLEWQVVCQNSVIPHEQGMSEDIRELACILQEVKFSEV